MRTKNSLPVRRRTFEYYSTLTHELVHTLGMGHFPSDQKFRAEIMFPSTHISCFSIFSLLLFLISLSNFDLRISNLYIYLGVGGTCIPRILPEHTEKPVEAHELPRLKKSPITISSLQWVYNSNTELKADGKKIENFPVYCKTCKSIGWLSMDVK